MASRRARVEALKHVLREEIDRIGAFIGAAVSAIATIVDPTPLTPLILLSQSAIAFFMAYRLRVSYRQAHKLIREKHLPVIVAIGCKFDEFKNMERQALEAVGKYDFDLKLYFRDYNLMMSDFTEYHTGWLPDDPQIWKGLVRRVQERIQTLDSRLLGRKIYHFFLRTPIAFSIGLGAALGTRYEFFFHHYQPGAGEENYHPVLQVTREKTRGAGAHILKTRVEKFQYVKAEVPKPAAGQAPGAVYVALWLAGHDPRQHAQKLAQQNGAHFVEIFPERFQGTIPLEADWLQIAREINTLLLDLAGHSVELHLFPAMPLPLGFAIGMGLGTRSPVRIYQWNASKGSYDEVLRLNELAGVD